ncbi:heavy-metal-associated domain-containing protein [Cyanobacterium stanieri LEGE 03274]|uniref:Heavy-metal-associated domain-containing protein n=1 Tax=Cyanobacterium stanieri LEGE 03274 TaxID=1828756 RepID=A0ABR9V6M7_9CHRO|nr:heavy-metal-associated domain-containing protein [Cyanobacterium stanieri]MBE9223156.1 heavy-metal-associated domain-containing protein [Cyanobacterium stanieri LEGE 03274]
MSVVESAFCLLLSTNIMISVKVPSIACEVCAETITKAIINTDPKAQVKIDVPTKIVNVETQTSIDVIKGAISQAGHECAD